jgi:putative DNA primase/helicase
LFFGHGPARSGKSTFAEALKAALGEYAGTADFASFLKSRDLKGGDRPRGDLVRLAGKRIVTSIEVDEGKSLAEGLVKSLTGRDTQVHRDLFQRGLDTHEVMPSYTLWMMANHRPKVRFEDDAIWERISLVGFPVHIPEAERDPQVKSRLMDASESGAAVLAWTMAGLEDYLSRGSLDPPDSVRSSTLAWRTDMDPLKPFLDECCVVGDGAVSYKDLMVTYADWAKRSGIPRFEMLSKAQMTPRLKELGCDPRTKEQPSGKTSILGWYGIALAEG